MSNAQEVHATPPSRSHLGAILDAIEYHDTDYDARYGFVLDAVALAHKLGYATGFRIDPSEPEWPVAMIELPWHDEHLWGDAETHTCTYRTTGRHHTAGEHKCDYTLSAIDRDLTERVWSLGNNGYLAQPRGETLHAVVAKRLFGAIPEGYEVDHIDQDPLHNDRRNFRLATLYGQRLNQRATGTGKPGQAIRQRGNSWQVRFGKDGNVIGSFASEAEAKEVAATYFANLVAKAHADRHYIYPKNQVSWHMPQHPIAWDRHDTAEKYRRVRSFSDGSD